MKTSTFKTGIFLVACLLIGMSTSAKELTKEFHKTFSATSSSKVYIENKFGSVEIQTGNQNQVIFDVIVKVESDNADTASKLLDRIDIILKSTGDKISGITELADKLSINDKGKSTKFTIDYTVTVPVDIEITIEHSFGNISIDELTGKTDIELSFGILNANSLTGPKTSISLANGSFLISNLGDADLELAFVGESKIKTARALSIESSHSNLSIGSIQSLSLEANFTQITVKNLQKNFTEVDIEANMSSVDIGLDPASGFSISADLSMCDMTFPDEMKNIVKKKDLMNSKLSGTYGNGKSTIQIDSNMGNVDIHFSK